MDSFLATFLRKLGLRSGDLVAEQPGVLGVVEMLDARRTDELQLDNLGKVGVLGIEEPDWLGGNLLP